MPSKKSIIRLLLLTVFSIFSALSAIYSLRIRPGSLNGTLMTLFFLFIYSRELPGLSAVKKRWIMIFSVILSAACIQGALLRIKGETYTGLVKENYIGYFSVRDAAALLISAFGFYYVIRLLLPVLQRINNRLQLKKPGEAAIFPGRKESVPQEAEKTGGSNNQDHVRRYTSSRLFSAEKKTSDPIPDSPSAVKKPFSDRNRFFLLTMSALFVCWLPYFIAYYPGFILGDSCSSIRQALGMDNLSNHYPVMYTLFIRLCLNIGGFFGSLTFGCAIYTLIQMLFLACALARSIQWLCRHGLPWQGGVLLTVFFGVTPFFGQISIAMWKDPVFSASLLLWTLLLLDHIRPLKPKRNKGNKSRRHRIDWIFLLKNSLLLLLICFTRNNGLYLCLFCALVFFLSFLLFGKRRRLITGLKEVVGSTLLAVILCAVITGPVFTAAGVQPTEKAEQVGVMMNQMARTVALSGNMSDRDREFMKKLLPLRKYKKAYRPCVVDLLKWDEDFNSDYLNTHSGEFYRTYISMGIKNPRCYFQAWELLTFGYWIPNQWELFYDGDNLGKGGLTSVKKDGELNKLIHPVYPVEKNRTGLRRIFNWTGTIPGLGTVSWILLFALLITVIERERTAMIALMPSLSLFLTLMLASPYYYWQRYGLAEYYLLPIYLYIILCYSGSAGRHSGRGFPRQPRSRTGLASSERSLNSPS